MFETILTVIEPWQLALLVILSFAGGLIRGYAGFGLSVTLITAASILLEPRLLVPVLYAMEVIASLAMLPTVLRHADGRLLLSMVAGVIATLPVGQILLVSLHPNMVRAFLSVFVLVCSVVALSGWRRVCSPSIPYGITIGAVFGIGSGLASIGGLGATLILMTTHPDPVRARAAGVLLFAASCTLAFPLSFTNGVAGSHTLPLLGLMVVPMLAGIFLGTRRFARTDIELFRRRVLWLILGLAVLLMISLIWRVGFSH